MNHRNTYLKQRYTNTAIRAYINVTQLCQGHVLNTHFSEICSKLCNNGAAEMYLEARISNEPGLLKMDTNKMSI